jgi:glutathione synthase/RimK-type ligase-like ATP-grasp enzyme
MEVIAERKPYQLHLAQTAGLTVPNTLISNDPRRVQEFVEESQGTAVFKTLTGTAPWFVPTSPFTSELTQDLGGLRHAPVLVQERIRKRAEVRVNIFGERVFAALVWRQDDQDTLDWRLDRSIVWEPHTLPHSVSDSLLRIMARLGLDYGCLDLCVRDDDEYVFLEVNPSGQFIFVELDTGQPLTLAMAQLLAGTEEKDAHTREATS